MALPVLEIRTYRVVPGRLERLLERFRDYSFPLFAKHGIDFVGYWTGTSHGQGGDVLIYVLAHASRTAAAANWEAFKTDPTWIRAKAASETDGPLVESIHTVFADGGQTPLT